MSILDDMKFLSKSDQSSFCILFFDLCFYILFWGTALSPIWIDVSLWMKILLATPSVMIIVHLSIALPIRFQGVANYWKFKIKIYCGIISEDDSAFVECRCYGLNKCIEYLQSLNSPNEISIVCVPESVNDFVSLFERLYIKHILPDDIKLKRIKDQKSKKYSLHVFSLKRLSRSQDLLSKL